MESSKKIYVVLAARNDTELLDFWNIAAYDNLLTALNHAEKYNAMVEDLDEWTLGDTEHVKKVYDPKMLNVLRELEDKNKPAVKYYVQELHVR